MPYRYCLALFLLAISMGCSKLNVNIVQSSMLTTQGISFTSSNQTFNENAGTAHILITIPAPLPDIVSVPLIVSGTATSGSDFTIASLTAVINPGSTSVDVTVVVNDDVIVEPNETITVTMGTPTNSSLGAITTHHLVIRDDDTPSISSVTIPVDGLYYEGDALDFTFVFSQSVIVTGIPQLNLNIGGTALTANYISGSGSANLTFRYVVSSTDSSISTTLSSPLNLAGGTIKNSLNVDALLSFTVPDMTGVIVDGRTLSLGFSSGVTVLPEAAGTGKQFTLNLSSAALTDFTIPFKVKSNASSTTDYYLPLSSIVIPAGQTSVTIPYDVLDDSVDENSKYFQLLIDRPTSKNNLKLTDTYGSQVSILDDDPIKDRWIAYGAGSVFNCGITTANVLKCWGDNTYGQLGDGTTVSKPTPVIIDSGTSYKAIAVGYYHACGITSTDVLKCWGLNDAGQVGDNTNTDKTTPTVVNSGTTYKFIAAGAQHSCGITSADVLKCWGSNFMNRLGYAGSDALTPVVVDSGVSYNFVSIRETTSCGITTGQVLKCWGRNTYGQIGDGTTFASLAPKVIDAGTSYIAVTNAYYHTCGITASNVLKCWGSNGSNELGDGTTTDSTLPKIVETGITYKSISAKLYSTCGVTTSNSLKCWGNGTNPTVNDSGVNYQSYILSQVGGCGLTSGNLLKCQGSNIIKSSPLLLPQIFEPSQNFLSITIPGSARCTIDSANILKCWGSYVGDGTNLTRNTPVIIDPGETYKKISSSSFAACGITTQDKLKCWGKNLYGQVGDGSTTERLKPLPIDPTNTYKEISLNALHTCGITTAGVLKCWGSNSWGNLGNGTTINSVTPIIIDPGVNYISVGTGSQHTCGITQTNVLKCWGRNDWGQIGNGTTVNVTSPTIIDSGVSYKFLASGTNSNNCAITTANQLKCWGYNFKGGLGDGTTAQKTTPTVIDSGTTYKFVVLGDYHSCGITSTDAVKCWGDNVYGQLGDGTKNSSLLPIVIDSGVAYKSISAAWANTCAITSADKAKCWPDMAQNFGSNFLQPAGNY